ncbi:MAG: NADH-quinone oxidoreductase subunit N [Desulfatitalea sp. BRH_c12]|nr:MAG: NADH-quinone oxidoreductase subunit N [Desulfatitalea sp. BRH_c12]
MMWQQFTPELYHFAAALLFTALSMTRRVDNRRDYWVALSLAGGGLIVCLAAVRAEGLLFLNTYKVDLFAQLFKVLLSMGLFLVVALCSELNGVARRWHSEFYLLLFTCTLAMMLLVSSVHLISIYVSLELSSYSLYVLVALRRDAAMGTQAALRYFLIGIFSSAIMLFGLALLYAATGLTYLSDLVQVLPGVIDQPLVLVAVVLTLGGFFFKLALFPFHFWAPDVYVGAPNQLAAFIATASKVAAVAVLLRVVAATGGQETLLVDSLAALAIISMTVGNLAALVQKDFKRLLAYSSIAQAGYVLIGILCMSPEGADAAIFYALALLLMKFTCFLAVVKIAADGGNPSLDALAGLHRRSPLLALALMMAVFALAGIPPTIGFTAKLLVFSAAMHKGYLVLVLIAMFNVVISLYYYLLIVKAAYLTEPAVETPAPVLSLSARALTTALIIAIVVVGFYPNPLIVMARQASSSLF